MRHVSAIVLLWLIPIQAVLAAEPMPALVDPTPAKGWIITLGASLQIGPDYDGAKSSGFSGIPSLNWRRAGTNEGFSAPDDGLDFALYETDRFSFGVVGDFKSGRYTRENRRLTGLRDVRWAVEAGLFAEFWPIEDRLRTRIELRQGFNGHHGIVADISADWVEEFGKFTFALGPRMMLGNRSYMNRNFGIAPWEAALNGVLPAYQAGAGVKSVGIASSLEYAWTPTWSTMLFARYDRMTSDAARSPIVRMIGDRNQFSVGVGASYSFTIGG